MKAFGFKTVATVALGVVAALAIVRIAKDADIPFLEDLLPGGLFS